jgi:WD40 repeat protein
VFTELVGPANVSGARKMDVSPDGNWAVSIAGRDELHVWNLSRPGRPQTISSEWLRSLSFHPSEPRLLITKRGGPESRAYLVVTNNAEPALLLGDPVPLPAPRNKQLNHVTTSVDGRFAGFVELASGRGWAGPVDSTNFVHLEGLGHNSLADYAGSARGSGSTSLSVDGSWLACGVSRGGMQIFDTRTGEGGLPNPSRF